jgi:hypothetical protein
MIDALKHKRSAVRRTTEVESSRATAIHERTIMNAANRDLSSEHFSCSFRTQQ